MNAVYKMGVKSQRERDAPEQRTRNERNFWHSGFQQIQQRGGSMFTTHPGAYLAYLQLSRRRSPEESEILIIYGAGQHRVVNWKCSLGRCRSVIGLGSLLDLT